MGRVVVFLWNQWFDEPIRRVEAESLAYRNSPSSQGADWKTIAVVLTSACCLTLQNYASSPDSVSGFAGFFANAFWGSDCRRQVQSTLQDWTLNQGLRLSWNGMMAFITYAIIPALVIKLAFREKLTDFGLGIRGIRGDWQVYAAFAALMLPLVWLFSGVERFQVTYPFYRIARREEVGFDFFRWELIYALQFVGLEFFFRGFMVHGTKHRFGAYSVFLMVVPYCMIHFHKPIPETMGAIVAGVALGMVSLATRSVWPGAALHISVAWGMDACCLARRGLIF